MPHTTMLLRGLFDTSGMCHACCDDECGTRAAGTTNSLVSAGRLLGALLCCERRMNTVDVRIPVPPAGNLRCPTVGVAWPAVFVALCCPGVRLSSPSRSYD